MFHTTFDDGPALARPAVPGEGAARRPDTGKPEAGKRRAGPCITTAAEFILLMSLAFAAGVVAAGFFLPELPR